MPRSNNARTCKIDAGNGSRGSSISIRRNSFSLTRQEPPPISRAKHGRCRRGRRLRAAIPHSHYKTVTLVAGLRLRGLTAAKTFDGPINAALFEDWVETCLVPTLSPGETVVMDNLPAHKGPRVEQLIKAAGAELRYLPAYSPDMNPIEKAFSKLKAFLRKLAERTVAGLMRALET